MNAMTLAFINMLEALKTMVTANLEKFTVIPAFAETFAEITSRLTTMQALKLTAVEKTKPTTSANLALKLKLCQKTVSVADTIRALAGKLGNIALKQEMDVKFYKLQKLAQGVLTPICQNIHDTATEHIGAAKNYNLSQAMLDELQTLITEYSTDVPDVRTETGEINTAKADIERLKAECTDILEGQLDPMVNILRETDPTALELWRSARVVVNPHSTPTQVKYTVIAIDNGVEIPIPDVPIIATGKITYTATTNELGEAITKPIAYGIFQITVTMPGFLPFLLKDFKMVRGKINKVEILLVRAV